MNRRYFGAVNPPGQIRLIDAPGWAATLLHWRQVNWRRLVNYKQMFNTDAKTQANIGRRSVGRRTQARLRSDQRNSRSAIPFRNFREQWRFGILHQPVLIDDK